MTCAKRVVMAALRTANEVRHHSYLGWNNCRKPQKKCPRLPGEGYAKCASICEQPWHAETDAIYHALADGVDPTGGTLVVDHEPCQECRDIMNAYKIQWTVV